MQKIAIIGNPNSGKSTVFNLLTGLRQKTGNYPGVTVERKSGIMHYGTKTIQIIDLPGIYTLHALSDDERVAVETILQEQENFDLFIYVADTQNLRRSLFLFYQLKDMGFPLLLVLNMVETAKNKQLYYDTFVLEELLKVPVVPVEAVKSKGVKRLMAEIVGFKNKQPINQTHEKQEASCHYETIDNVLQISRNDLSQTTPTKSFSEKLDIYLLHNIWGYVIFALAMFIVFQAVFTLAAFPMVWIENLFLFTTEQLTALGKKNIGIELLAEGLLPGISGVLVFLPQIAILFLMLSLLEESGYMTRATYLMDGFMQKIGLHGRSVLPLLSGTACAIPAVMATRSIPDAKERLITILIIPLLTCSAKLPVFILLISMLMPEYYYFGILSNRALSMSLIYFSAFLVSALAATLLNKILSKGQQKPFIMELPNYKMPQWQNLIPNIYLRCKAFVSGAGKIILVVSFVLWFLASFGPKAGLFSEPARTENISNSYAGVLGRGIEPAIKPLGYDWKIGIALITSFAAREVFVGTLATIYATSNTATQAQLRLEEKLKLEKKPDGSPQFGKATLISLLLFYFFALQCFSTMAITKKETGSWKWPLLQFAVFGSLGYIFAFISQFMFL